VNSNEKQTVANAILGLVAAINLLDDGDGDGKDRKIAEVVRLVNDLLSSRTTV
jgi:hypothetical protein